MGDGPARTGTDHDLDGMRPTRATPPQRRLDFGRSLLLAGEVTYAAGWALGFATCVYVLRRSEVDLLALLAARVVPTILDGPPIRWIVSRFPGRPAMLACNAVAALLVGTLLLPDRPSLWQRCLVVGAVASFCGDLFEELAVHQFRGAEPPIARITGMWASPRRLRLIRAPLVALPTALALGDSMRPAAAVLVGYYAIAASLVGPARKPASPLAFPSDAG